MTREKERITLSLDVLKDKFRESDSYDLDSDEIEIYMKESLYGNEEVSYPMDKESFMLARGQIDKICTHLESVGLSNAGGIRDKFQNPPDTKEGYEILSKIKATMESIVFTIDKVTNLSRDEVAAQYRDRQFACGPGTLSNLQSISSEMVLANQGIEAYIVEQKRKTLEQIAIHALMEKKFPVFDREPVYDELGRLININAGMEVHDAASLINLVAAEYKIKAKDSSEDPYITSEERLPSEYKTLFTSIVKDKLARPEFAESFVDSISDEIYKNLPQYSSQPGQEAEFPIKVQEFISNLDIGEVKLPALLKMEYGVSKGYKDNINQVISDHVSQHLHEQSLINDPQIDLCRARIKIENSIDSEDGTLTKDAIDYLKEKDLQEYGIKYIIDNNMRLDTFDTGLPESPIDYARRENIKINGIDPLEYAVRTGLFDGDKSAAQRAYEEGLQIDGIDAFEFVIREGVSIGEKDPVIYLSEQGISLGENKKHPILHAIESGFPIDGKDPILYAGEKGLNLDGQNPFEYALLKDLKIEGKPAADYCWDNKILIDDKSAYDYCWKNHIRIQDQDPRLYYIKKFPGTSKGIVELMINKNIQVDGKSAIRAFLSMEDSDIRNYAINYAHEKSPKLFVKEVLHNLLEEGYNINGEHPLKYAVDNDITLYEFENAFDCAYNNISIYPDSGLGDSKFDLSKYAIEKDLKIQGMAAVDYLEAQQIKIMEGDKAISPIEYALEKGYKVNGEHPLKYAVDNDITLYEFENAFEYAYSKFSEYLDNGLGDSKFDLSKYAIEKDLKIQGMAAVDYLEAQQIKIMEGDKAISPIEYALEKGYKVNGEHPLKYAVDNDIALYKYDNAFEYAYSNFSKYPDNGLGDSQDDLSKYAIEKDLKIDGISAVDYFIGESISIMKGDKAISPIEYALENGYKVNGEHALKYAVDNDITLYEYDNAFEYAYNNIRKYPGSGLGDSKFDLSKYAIEKDLEIDGTIAVDYLEAQQIKIMEGDKFIPPREYGTKIKATQIGDEAQRLVRSGQTPNGQDIQKKKAQKRGMGS